MTNTYAHRLQGMKLENGMQIFFKIPRSKMRLGEIYRALKEFNASCSVYRKHKK